MQLVVPKELRGRAVGTWVVAVGTAPLGNFQIGLMASNFTIGFALGINGVVLLGIAIIALIFLPKIRNI